MNKEVKEKILSKVKGLTEYEVNELLTYINKLERINDEQYKVIKEGKEYITECARLQTIIDKTKENINDNINLLKTGVKRNSKHITITEAISILETILIQMN